MSALGWIIASILAIQLFRLHTKQRRIAVLVRTLADFHANSCRYLELSVQVMDINKGKKDALKTLFPEPEHAVDAMERFANDDRVRDQFKKASEFLKNGTVMFDELVKTADA